MISQYDLACIMDVVCDNLSDLLPDDDVEQMCYYIRNGIERFCEVEEE